MKHKVQTVMVGWLILLFLLVFGVLFPLTIGLYFKGKAKADKMTTTTNTSTTCVETSTTPTPSPTLSPTSTPIVFDWEVDEQNGELTLAEKQEIALMCDNLIQTLEEQYPQDAEEVIAEQSRLMTIRDQYITDINDWNVKVEEYPTACTIWLYLTEEMELSNEAAAGVMGNMMVEAGSYSLSINEYAYGDGYYGICQWSTSYHWRANGLDLQGQLDYLAETIESEFGYGSSTYEQFINAETARDASIYFARGYERCANPSGRQTTADTAYQYFVEWVPSAEGSV